MIYPLSKIFETSKNYKEKPKVYYVYYVTKKKLI